MQTNRTPEDRQFLMVGILLVVVLIALASQAAAVAVTAWAVGDQVNLGLFQLLTLWVHADPTEVTGLPASSAVWHWLIVVLVASVMISVVMVAYAKITKRAEDPLRKKGLEDPGVLAKALGRKAVMKQASNLRPHEENPKITSLAWRIGDFKGTDVFTTFERAVVVVGPSRSGKGWFIVLNWILDFDGAVVTTSSKADNLVWTMKARQRKYPDGPIWIFDPAEVVSGLGHRLKWDPIAGCEDFEIADRRAQALAESKFGGSTENGGYWDSIGKKVLTAMLHAAALGGRNIHDVWAWYQNRADAAEAVQIIRDHGGERSSATYLSSVVTARAEDGEKYWSSAEAAVDYLTLPSVREMLIVREGETSIDVESFIRNKGTLYLVANEISGARYQALLDAMFEEIRSVAEIMATASPTQRIDPPMALISDEAANFKITSLPYLISAGGSLGIVAVCVVQTKSQLDSWPDGQGKTMFGSAPTRLILPGMVEGDEARELETLLGTVERQRVSVTQGREVSFNTQLEERAVFTASEISNIPKGSAIGLLPPSKPVIIKMSPFNDRADFKQLVEDRKSLMPALSEAARKVLEAYARQ